MSYPDTPTAAAERIRRRILRAAEELSAEPGWYDEDDEARIFRDAAERGAIGYAEMLGRVIASGSVDDAVLGRADLVASAAECAGWIGATQPGREEPISVLVADGWFVFHPAVPGKWVACYRLTD